MKKLKLKLSILVVLFPLVLKAQKHLTQEQISEDYTVFKNILVNGHPSLYEYTSISKWDILFQKFEEEKIQLTTTADLFKSINSLANNVKDGHLVVHHPKIDTIPPMFPLLVKIIDKRIYTDTDDFGIPVGSEIISIDSINSKELLNRMLKYAPSDGFNLTKKYRQIESEFSVMYYYEFGVKNRFIVNYQTPDNQNKIAVINSEPLKSIGARSVKRKSYYLTYYGNTNKAEHLKNTVKQNLPYLYFIDSLDAAVLTVNSFGLDPREFKSKLITLFKNIKKKKVNSLIIDVRQNIGGYRINAINLFSFITQKTFKQRTSESAITSTLPEKEYVIHTMSDYEQFFKTYFSKAKKEGNQWVLSSDHAEAEMKPYKKTFKGKVFVLIGGKTFSAGTAFALSAKNHSDITLVGEETGGGYYSHTGQYPALYQLPNSKIMVRMSLVKINKYVEDKSVAKGSGVLPDVEIKLSSKNLIEGKDSALEYIVKQIRKD